MSDHKPHNKQALFDNVAQLTQTENHSQCECCNSPLLFAMRDNTHEFMLDLPTILKCLAIAEEHGEVPKLSDAFWVNVKNRFSL